jgi:mannitol 2-dehydrogenase
MCAGSREDGSEIAANDPEWDSLRERALAARTAPSVWLALYGDLADAPRFRAAFSDALAIVWRAGTRAAIRNHVA